MHAVYQAIEGAFGEGGGAAMAQYEERLRGPRTAVAKAPPDDDATAAANLKNWIGTLAAAGAVIG